MHTQQKTPDDTVKGSKWIDIVFYSNTYNYSLE